MNILGIETSCDDTCISLLKVEKSEVKKDFPRFKIISSFVSSQVEIHRKWGGVYPTLAKREHQKNLPIILKKTLKKAEESKESKIDFIAVTIGPGLDPCLWTGLNFAKEKSDLWKIPVVPVNHIEAHLIISLFSLKEKMLIPTSGKIFPAIGLVVSGGHTLIALINKIGKYKILGETRDDAAGECFDKTARILGLGYPGGPAIAAKAAECRNFKLNRTKTTPVLPRPMIHSKNFDFSFSGLKTATLYHYKSTPKRTKESGFYKAKMANEIQQAIIDVLIKKTMAATEKYQIESIILGGGVVANKELKSQFKKASKKIKIFFPPEKMQTDNAIMIAVTGFFKKQLMLKKNKTEPNLKL